MNVLDQDMQMVRDFLAQSKAPFHITSHFENLVSEHAKEAGRASDLEELRRSHMTIECERDELQEQVDELEAELDARDGAAFGALETVKYWLLDVLVHGRPMQKPPRQILRIMEEAL